MSVNRRDFLRSVASISGATLASTVSFAQNKSSSSMHRSRARIFPASSTLSL